MENEGVMETITDFRYTPRADMATDIGDFLEVVGYLQRLEKEVAELRAKLAEMGGEDAK